MASTTEDYICWPYWLPEPERTDYSYSTSTQTVERTEMDVGAVMRRLFDTDETVFQCQVQLEDCEASYFEAFEQWLLSQGSKWFLMPIWVGGEKQHYVAQFTERPKMDSVQGFTDFWSFSVRIKKRLLRPVSTIEVGSRGFLVTWPKNLPVLQDSYSYELRSTDLPGNGELTTYRKPEFNVDEATITCKLSLNPKQQNLFEWFERDVLNHGTRWFRMPVWIGGALRTHIVRFNERPQAALDGFWCSYTFKLDIEQRHIMDRTLLAWLTVLSPDDLFIVLDIISDMEEGMGSLQVPDFWNNYCKGGTIIYEWAL